MTEETLLEESAENIVDVEDELRDRKREAVRRAEEEATDDEEMDAVRYWSPPVAGTSDIKKRRHGSDMIDLRLMQELPDGTDSFTVPLPDADDVEDPSHQFNRLLSHHGIDHGETSNLIGERLPLRPKGDYDDPESMHFEIDYPPVPTLPNRVLWRGKRAVERLGLVRWGKTPRANRDMWGDLKSLHFDDGRSAKVMSKSATGLVEPCGILPENEETLVPTDRGVAALLGLGSIVALGPLAAGGMAQSGSIILLGIIWMLVAALVMLPLWWYAVMTWAGQARRWAKQRFFPSAD